MRVQSARPIGRVAIGCTTVLALGLVLTSCARVVTTQYEASATTLYTWQVEYQPNPDKPIRNRRKKFATVSLVNRNGARPIDAASGPDDQGLWWPAIPPRPTVDQIESERRSSDEVVGPPQLIKDVKYAITYEAQGKAVTLPTNHSVYRQVVKAYPTQQPLELTVAGNENFVTQARPTLQNRSQ